MKISKKKQEEIYAAIREEIVDIRIDLKLSPKDDVKLAQVETNIWSKIKEILWKLEHHLLVNYPRLK